MFVKDIIYEDFCNYKEPSMFIIFPKCSFKCNKENGNCVCQNISLTNEKDIYVTEESIVKKFISNNITKAIVCGGLEPFDSWEDLKSLVKTARNYTDAKIVIYTGYYKDELQDKVLWLSKYKNIIIKYGRFIPNQKPHYDKILGIDLVSDNQYAEVIS